MIQYTLEFYEDYDEIPDALMEGKDQLHPVEEGCNTYAQRILDDECEHEAFIRTLHAMEDLIACNDAPLLLHAVTKILRTIQETVVKDPDPKARENPLSRKLGLSKEPGKWWLHYRMAMALNSEYAKPGIMLDVASDNLQAITGRGESTYRKMRGLYRDAPVVEGEALEELIKGLTKR